MFSYYVVSAANSASDKALGKNKDCFKINPLPSATILENSNVFACSV